MTAARLSLGADRRTPFVQTLRFEDYDLTGATFKAQVRQYPDALGVPQADLATVVSSSAEGLKLLYAGTATVAAHVSAGRVQRDEYPDLADTDPLLISIVQIRINQSTMEAMPAAGEPGGDVTLSWDLHVTIGSLKERWLFGDFVVLGGVTR